MIAVEEVNNPCCICGQHDSTVLFETLFERWRYNRQFVMRKCCGCGLLFNSPRLPQEELKDHYNDDYYIGHPIYIFKSNMTLDCNYNDFIHDNSCITVKNSSRVTVKNGNFFEDINSVSISVSNSNEIFIYDNYFFSVSIGIKLESTINNIINNNKFIPIVVPYKIDKYLTIYVQYDNIFVVDIGKVSGFTNSSHNNEVLNDFDEWKWQQ